MNSSLCQKTAAHPFSKSLSTLYGKHPDVQVRITRLQEPGSFWIQCIHVDGERRKGAGSRFLVELTDLADQLQVALHLKVHAMPYEIDEHVELESERIRRAVENSRSLSNEQLIEWYGRHGFVLTGEVDEDGDVLMVREPA